MVATATGRIQEVGVRTQGKCVHLVTSVAVMILNQRNTKHKKYVVIFELKKTLALSVRLVVS